MYMYAAIAIYIDTENGSLFSLVANDNGNQRLLCQQTCPTMVILYVCNTLFQVMAINEDFFLTFIL